MMSGCIPYNTSFASQTYFPAIKASYVCIKPGCRGHEYYVIVGENDSRVVAKVGGHPFSRGDFILSLMDYGVVTAAGISI